MGDSVRVDLDSREFVANVSRLAELLERVFQAVNRSVDVPHAIPQALGVIVRNDSALGTGDVRVTLKPSDGLLELVAALETLERDLSGAEMLSH